MESQNKNAFIRVFKTQEFKSLCCGCVFYSFRGTTYDERYIGSARYIYTFSAFTESGKVVKFFYLTSDEGCWQGLYFQKLFGISQDAFKQGEVLMVDEKVNLLV